MGFPAPGAYEAKIASINEQRRAASQAQAQQSYLSQAIAATNQSNQANKKRELQVLAIYDEMVNRYQPGGSFETKSLAQIEKQKNRYVEQGYGAETQGNISSGLYGTTAQTGIKGRLSKDYEADVAQPSRLQLEDVLMQRLSGAQQGKAGFLSSIEDVGPSLSDLYSMGAQAGSSQGGSYSPTSGSSPSSPTSVTGTTPSTPRVYGQSAKGTSARPPGSMGASAGLSSWATHGSGSGTGDANVKPHAQGFVSTFNYMATLYNRGGGKASSQQEAFSKLQASGWKG